MPVARIVVDTENGEHADDLAARLVHREHPSDSRTQGVVAIVGDQQHPFGPGRT
jgi:hypothetical protein